MKKKYNDYINNKPTFDKKTTLAIMGLILVIYTLLAQLVFTI